MSHTHQGAERPGDPGRNRGRISPQALTDSNSHQFQSRGEKCMCVSICEHVCVLKARWEAKMTAQQLTVKQFKRSCSLRKTVPSASAGNFKRTGNTAAGLCTGLAHTHTCDECFLWPWPTENSPNNLSVSNEEIKGYRADSGTATTRHHGGIYASNPHTPGCCRAEELGTATTPHLWKVSEESQKSSCLQEGVEGSRMVPTAYSYPELQGRHALTWLTADKSAS